MTHEVPSTPAQTALDLPQLVRSRDYRRFLAIQFAPRGERPVLYALTAFATEMAHIPDHVREPLAGFMRYAWWREALQAMEEGHPPRAHPLLQELAAWLAVHPQGFAPLYALIETGQMRLEDLANEAADAKEEQALDALWAQAAPSNKSIPLEILKSLPKDRQIGPLTIARLIIKSLRM